MLMSRPPIRKTDYPRTERCRRLAGRFADAPYQTYQLLKIPDANAPFIATAAESVDEARKAPARRRKPRGAGDR